MTAKENVDLKSKVSTAKGAVAALERTDVIGLRKKLLKLQKQNQMLKSNVKVR
jgi:hypothetical protein